MIYLIAAIIRQAIKDSLSEDAGRIIYNGKFVNYSPQEAKKFLESEYADFLIANLNQDYLLEKIFQD